MGAGGSKGKLDLSKQSKAESFVGGWANTFKRLRSLAVIILLAVIGFTIVSSILGRSKFFPHQPSRTQIQKARIIKDIKQFHFRQK